eukprot:366097-Chlamydomonas_euryale.AAC.34
MRVLAEDTCRRPAGLQAGTPVCALMDCRVQESHMAWVDLVGLCSYVKTCMRLFCWKSGQQVARRGPSKQGCTATTSLDAESKILYHAAKDSHRPGACIVHASCCQLQADKVHALSVQMAVACGNRCVKRRGWTRRSRL